MVIVWGNLWRSEKGHAYVDINTALKEVTGIKWPFEKVSEAMKNLIEKYIIDDKRHVAWDKLGPEADQLCFEAGWDSEEYHWESITSCH